MPAGPGRAKGGYRGARASVEFLRLRMKLRMWSSKRRPRKGSVRRAKTYPNPRSQQLLARERSLRCLNKSEQPHPSRWIDGKPGGHHEGLPAAHAGAGSAQHCSRSNLRLCRAFIFAIDIPFYERLGTALPARQ